MTNTELKNKILNNKTAYQLFKQAQKLIKSGASDFQGTFYFTTLKACKVCVKIADMLGTDRMQVFLVAYGQQF